jgi:hypothetical protein
VRDGKFAMIITFLFNFILMRGFNLPAQQAVDAVRIADLGS